MKFQIRTALAAVFAVLLLLFTVGCVDSRIGVAVNKDGSADLTLRVTADSSLAVYLGTGTDVLAEYRNEALDAGFEISEIDGNGETGFLASKHVDDLKTSVAMGRLFGLSFFDPELSTGSGFFITESPFKTTYRVELDYDNSLLSDYVDPGLVTSSLRNVLNAEFVLTLPVVPSEHNADSVSPDGKTLTWNLLAEGSTGIQAKAEVYKVGNMIALGVLVLVLILIVVLYSRRALLRHGRRREDDRKDEPPVRQERNP